MSNVDTKKYLEFVNGVTSQESKDSEAFTSRIADLYHHRTFLPSDCLLLL